MHDPRERHLPALKRILRYIKGTAALGLSINSGDITQLNAYSDADWAGCPDSLRSIDEAEYKAVANSVADSYWLRSLLAELNSRISKATLVFLYLSTNSIQH
ncbi:hypothetical protein V2J09_003472 [Rumex salicifolius]